MTPPCETCERLTKERNILDQLWWMFFSWNMPTKTHWAMGRLHEADVKLARHKAEHEEAK